MARRHKSPLLGEHGYDNAAPQMGALFIANGPAFVQSGEVVKPFPNVDVYPLMTHVLGIKGEPSDGRSIRLSRTSWRTDLVIMSGGPEDPAA